MSITRLLSIFPYSSNADFSINFVGISSWKRIYRNTRGWSLFQKYFENFRLDVPSFPFSERERKAIRDSSYILFQKRRIALRRRKFCRLSPRDEISNIFLEQSIFFYQAKRAIDIFSNGTQSDKWSNRFLVGSFISLK